ncbi:hypothetical protein BJ322DRAFT_1017177 [Thelephora terrestris]|uniref:Uncharacterized protein n=1 Tax=Thelephora terrestris TaxID=56493 RepID=A0A9P6HMQ3_9AGAM|nr:hypothetical protein BJ322DRAFT_1017177 [Thelephora terrestris]
MERPGVLDGFNLESTTEARKTLDAEWVAHARNARRATAMLPSNFDYLVHWRWATSHTPRSPRCGRQIPGTVGFLQVVTVALGDFQLIFVEIRREPLTDSYYARGRAPRKQDHPDVLQRVFRRWEARDTRWSLTAEAFDGILLGS